MNAELRDKLRAAEDVFARKEAIEALIHEEKLKIHAQEYHLQMLDYKRDMKRQNRYDRGRCLGSMFAFIGFFFFWAIIAVIIGVISGDVPRNLEDALIMAVFLAAGVPPIVVGTCLLAAYYRGKKPRAAAAELAKAEYEEYSENTAAPVIRKCRAKISGMEAQIAGILGENADITAFLPEHCRNAASAGFMAQCVENGSAQDIEQAARLCKKENAGASYRKTVKLREKVLAEKYKDPMEHDDQHNSFFSWILAELLFKIFR